MAVIEKTIATSGGDYTSRSLAEASIPGAGSDQYIFTVNEAFTDTTIVTCSFGTGNTMEVTVAAAYRCNGAVSGSHAELVYSTNDTNNLITDAVGALVTWRHDRLIRSGSTQGAADTVDNGASAGGITLDRCTIIRRGSGATGGRCLRDLPSAAAGSMNVYGCFIVDSGRNSAAIDVCMFQTPSVAKFYRNTVFIPDGTAQSGVHNNGASAAVDVRQSLSIKASGATCATMFKATTGSYNASSDANGATDTTCPGTNANNSLTDTNVIKTLTVNSEDLHYPSRAAMTALTAGSDLSATTGTVDLDGDTIAAWYPGADYVPATASAAASANRSKSRLTIRGLGL